MAVKPRIKLDKKEAKKGDIVEVKALVSHVMETGQRRDDAGNTVPRKILNKFTCTVNGKQVFAADFEPAISANPYIQFKFKAQESGPVVLTWTDDDGIDHRRRRDDHGQLSRARHSGAPMARARRSGRLSACSPGFRAAASVSRFGMRASG